MTFKSLPLQYSIALESGPQAAEYTEFALVAMVDRSIPAPDHTLTCPSSPAVKIAVPASDKVEQ